MLAQWISAHGYPVIFALFAFGIIGLPVPSELLLAYLGYLVFQGKLDPLLTVTVAFFGSGCGMAVNYLLGRTIGCYLVRRFGKLIHVTPEKIAAIHDWFERKGRWGLLFGFFLPGVRHLTAFVAGTSRMGFPEFAVFTAGGALVWTSLFIGLGYALEDQWSLQTARIHHVLELGSLITLAFLSLYLLLRKKTDGSNPR